MSHPQITGFEVIECLGQGGMATVWKARQLSLDRIVAIKILSPRMARDAGDIERFVKEAKSAAKLKHQGIIQVYDVNAEGGLYFIVMEYVAGYTVGDWLRRKGVLSEEDALLVVDSVADALDYAWTKEGIIHCDIKPDNIIIDSDGTVKVADLGLARTITAMSSREDSEYVMGTPAYMAPEQARGDGDLDCRADIYSLGAMLYHLVTGQILFEGNADERVMDLQIDNSSTVDDPMDLNPKLSKPLCWLIEKMLAKKREGRPVDWAAVRADIGRVKKGRMPGGPMLPENSSAVSRSARRTAHDHVQVHHHTSSTMGRKPVKKPFPVAGVLVAVLVAIVVVIWAIASLNAPKTKPVPVVASKPRATPAPVKPSVQPVTPTPSKSAAEQNAMDMYDFARKWITANADKYAEGIARMEKVAKETKGTKYSLMAEDDIRNLTSALDQRVDKVIDGLRQGAKGFLDKNEFDRAAAVFEGYAGSFVSESALRRKQMVDDIHQRQKDFEADRKQNTEAAEKKMAALLDEVVSKLLSEGILAAYNEVVTESKAPELVLKEPELKKLLAFFDSVIALDNRILDSFSGQVGQEVAVNLNSGPVLVTIKSISAGKVAGVQKLSPGSSATKPLEFDVDALAQSEKLKRMGQDNVPEVAFAKGLLAFSAKAYPIARRSFGATYPLLVEKLVKAADDAEKRVADEDSDRGAERSLAALLRALGYSVGSYDKDAWLKAIADKAVPAGKQKQVNEFVDKYKRDFGMTRFGKDAAPILRALTE